MLRMRSDLMRGSSVWRLMSVHSLAYPWTIRELGSSGFPQGTYALPRSTYGIMYNAVISGGDEAVPGFFVVCDEAIPRHVQRLQGIERGEVC